MIMTLDDVKNLPPLSDEEIRILEEANPTPSDDCPAMTQEELKEFRPWTKRSKKAVTINLDNRVITYFKGLSDETGVPYQTLMNLYLVQCTEERKRPVFMSSVSRGRFS